MKNLNNIVRTCMEELDRINIKYAKKITFKVNTRACRRWGNCSSYYGGYIIEISDRLLQDNITDNAVKDTIIHELLHTVSGCMNHGKKWKELADKVNRAYGYNIKRCASYDEKGIDPIEPTYVVKCSNPNCKCVFNRYRMCDLVKNHTFYSCGRCGSKLIRVK